MEGDRGRSLGLFVSFFRLFAGLVFGKGGGVQSLVGTELKIGRRCRCQSQLLML